MLAAIPGHAAAGSVDARCFMYTGVSLLSSRAHSQLPDDGCLIRDGYARWLARGERIAAYVDETASFRDVGVSLWHYLEANLAFASGQLRWSGIAAPGSQGLVDPSVRLETGATLHECVVGAQAQIAAGVRLERCVVWPDTSVTASYSDAILLPNGRVAAVDPTLGQHGPDRWQMGPGRGQP
jgi:NDP-sugar pyrophosphorylase family protein